MNGGSNCDVIVSDIDKFFENNEDTIMKVLIKIIYTNYY